MSACNQGRYLAETIASARESVRGRVALEIVVVDDHSEDDSCRDLTDVDVLIRPPQRLGCSAGRRLAASKATGDVIIISDPHCFYNSRALQMLADAAIAGDAIVQPTVVVEGKTMVRGGTLILRRDGLAMGRVGSAAKYPTLYGSIYAMSRPTYQRLGGLPTLPGVWGKYEQYLTLTAYRLGVGIQVLSGATCTHRRYRVPKIFPYFVPWADPIRNSFWVHAGCLPWAYGEVFERLLVKCFGPDDEYRADLRTPAFLEFREWLSTRAVWSEQDLIARVARVKNIHENPAVKRVLGGT